MINFLKRASCLTAIVLAAAFVAACGGGGSSDPVVVPPAPLLAQYQGTWTQMCEQRKNNAGLVVGSRRGTVLVGAPNAAGSVVVGGSEQYFSSPNCSGEAIATVTQTQGTLSAAGTKTVGPITVVKILSAFPAGDITYSGPGALVGLANCLVGRPPVPSLTIKSGADVLASCILVSEAAGNEKAIFSVVSLSNSPNTFDVYFTDNGGGGVVVDAEGFPNTLFANVEEGRLTRK